MLASGSIVLLLELTYAVEVCALQIYNRGRRRDYLGRTVPSTF